MIFHRTFLLYYIVINFISVRSSEEGTQCTVDGKVGKCTNMFRCPMVRGVLAKGNDPAICSFQGKVPVVCCPDVLPVRPSPPSVKNRIGENLKKTGQKAWDKCVDYLDTLPYECKNNYYYEADPSTYDKDISTVIGGNNTFKGQFPHMALLGFSPNENLVEWQCGGTVISERFILTAGHCKSSPRFGLVKYAALGMLSRTDPVESWDKYEIQRIISHPDYTPPLTYNDIALLETTKGITFNRYILPACLPVTRQPQMDDETAIATGWGSIGIQNVADILQMVKINKLGEEACASRSVNTDRHMPYGFNSTTQLCYGDQHNLRNTCEGDSGGPLQISGQVSQCVYTVIGVTSRGKPCSVLGSAGIYTRVHHFVPWIESVVWNN